MRESPLNRSLLHPAVHKIDKITTYGIIDSLKKKKKKKTGRYKRKKWDEYGNFPHVLPNEHKKIVGWLFLLSASSYSGPRGDKGGVVIKWFLRVAVTGSAIFAVQGELGTASLALVKGKKKMEETARKMAIAYPFDK